MPRGGRSVCQVCNADKSCMGKAMHVRGAEERMLSCCVGGPREKKMKDIRLIMNYVGLRPNKIKHKNKNK